MKLADLKQGMVCLLRNNESIVILDGGSYHHERYKDRPYLTDRYNEDLTHKEDNNFDIIKVSYGDKVLFEREEKVKWFEPKENEGYYHVSPFGKIIALNNKRDEDKEVIAFSQVFKTYEEAEQHLKYKQAELKIIKWIAQNDNVVLDWEDEKPNKWIVFYSHENKKLMKNNNIFSQYLPKHFYLSNKELAQRLIDELGTELKIWLGVEE